MAAKLLISSLQARCGVGGGEEVAKALNIIWDYIKQHNLQDPANEKIIACDEKLKKLFGGKEHVGFLEIPRLLDPHFAK